MAIKFKGISDVDGRTVEVPANEMKDFVSAKKLSFLLRYDYSSSTSPPPNAGQIRLNDEDVENCTDIWIHRQDFDNRDDKMLFKQAEKNDRLYIQDMNDSDSYALFALTKDAVDDGDYVTLKVACVEVTDVALAGKAVLVGVFL